EPVAFAPGAVPDERVGHGVEPGARVAPERGVDRMAPPQATRIHVQLDEAGLAGRRQGPLLGRDRAGPAGDLEYDIRLPEQLVPPREPTVAPDHTEGERIGLGD